MIRPFDWRDVPLLHRLRDRGLCLDSQQALTHGPHALQHALLGALNPTGIACTLVARSGQGVEEAAVGQILQRNGNGLFRLAFFSPEEAILQPAGLSLLEALCQAAGARGARNLIAETEEDSPAFDCLRQAGFAIYARQQIWRLGAAEQSAAPAPGMPRRRTRARSGAGLPDEATSRQWRPEAAPDRSAIQVLYLNLVPALVQQIEPPPGRSGRGLVHWREDELLGYIDIERGPLGIWTQPYFHPAAERTEALLAGFLQTFSDGRGPLYVCVRSYQGWMNGVLERLEFAPSHNQAVMVKRLAVSIRRPALAPLPALEATRPKPTTPFAQLQNRPPAQGAGHRS
jgi:hypothetical protein